MPRAVLPGSHGGSKTVAKVLTTAAHGLAWLWLAADLEQANGDVQARFEGEASRRVSLDDRTLAGPIEPVLALWDWAVDGRDRLRFDSIQHAVSFTVTDREVLNKVAGSSTSLDVVPATSAICGWARWLRRPQAAPPGRTAAPDGRS